MRILITGGTGVLARASIPLLRNAGHQIDARGRGELDLFDPTSVGDAVEDSDAVMHLATSIPPKEEQGNAEAWRVNDRIRSEATPILVDSALEAGVERFVFPSIAFVYGDGGPADESTPVAEPAPELARSALDAERELERFTEADRDGVILRLGLLYGPGTGSEVPSPRFASFGATLRIEDAGSALAVSLELPPGIYNVTSDGERISNHRLKEASDWRPEHGAQVRPEVSS